MKTIHRLVAGISVLALAGMAWAQSGAPAEPVALHIAAQPLDQALNEFAQQTGLQVIFRADQIGNGWTSKEIAGKFTTEDALKILLADSGLQYKYLNDRTIAVRPKEEAEDKAERITDAGSDDSEAIRLAQASAAGEDPANPERRAAEEGGVSNTSENSDGVKLEEIVVTAQKRQERLQEIPFAVFAQSGSQLEDRGIDDLQTLQVAVPGLLVSESGSFQRRISIRGIGNAFGSSSLVGIYVDEAAVTTIPSNQLDLRIFDLERVEVLKGPQGTLYGEGSVGGTIRFITRNPDLSELSGNLSLNTSSINDGSLGNELRGVLNVPLSDRLGVRIAAQYVDFGGWIDQPALGRKDINSYELANIRAKLLWQPSENLDIVATAITHRNDGRAQNMGEDDNGHYRQAFDNPTTPTSEDDYDLFNLTAQYDFSGFSLLSSTSQLDTERAAHNIGNECCVPLASGDGYWNLLFPDFSLSSDIFTQELRLVSGDSGAVSWTLGGFYRDADTTPSDIPNGFLFGEPGGTPGVDLFTFGPSARQEISQSWAVFGELGYQLTERLEAGVGLRFFEDDRSFRAALSGPYQEDTFSSLNPRFFVSYAPSEDLNIYFNAAKGFRSGGFNAAGQPTFDPESIRSYELGAKGRFLDPRLYLEVAGFFSQYEDYQIVGIVPLLGITVTANAGEAEIRGVDLSLGFDATESLQLGFTATHLDSEFTRINVTSTSHAVGDPLDMVPEYALSAWAGYSFAWPGGNPGRFRLDYSQQGRSYFRNRSSGPDYVSSSDVVDLVNARLAWQRENVSLDLYALNLLNERGYLGPIVIEQNAERAMPLTVGLQLRLEF